MFLLQGLHDLTPQKAREAVFATFGQLGSPERIGTRILEFPGIVKLLGSFADCLEGVEDYSPETRRSMLGGAMIAVWALIDGAEIENASLLVPQLPSFEG